MVDRLDLGHATGLVHHPIARLEREPKVRIRCHVLFLILRHRRVPSCVCPTGRARQPASERSEEHTSELQSQMRISYAVFCLKKKHTKKRSNKSDDNNETN